MSKGLYSLLPTLLCMGSAFAEDITISSDAEVGDEVAPICAPLEPPTAPSVTTLDDLAGGFKIEADLRIKYKGESARDGAQRIIGSGTSFPDKAFRNEFNLYVYYEGKQTIGSARLKYDNRMGMLGGTTNAISLPKAYFGRQLFRAGATSMRIGLGRRPLDELFESSVQFSSRIDGGYVGMLSSVPGAFDFGIDFIGTLVDAQYNQYAWGTELEFNNIRSYGIYFKYAYLDWVKRGVSAQTDGSGNKTGVVIRNNPQYQYRTSQFLLGYILGPVYFNTPFRAFAAFIVNHAAQEQTFLDNRKEKTAWYVGFQLGSGKKPGGFSIDYTYQFVRAQSIQQLDVGGIGNGNPRNNSIYGPVLNDVTGAAETVSTATANGNTNFKGWELKGLYRYTQHISWKLIYKCSKPANKAIGPDRKFKKFESQWIYNF